MATEIDRNQIDTDRISESLIARFDSEIDVDEYVSVLRKMSSTEKDIFYSIVVQLLEDGVEITTTLSRKKRLLRKEINDLFV